MAPKATYLLNMQATAANKKIHLFRLIRLPNKSNGLKGAQKVLPIMPIILQNPSGSCQNSSM